eukprot:gene21161-64118_t
MFAVGLLPQLARTGVPPVLQAEVVWSVATIGILLVDWGASSLIAYRAWSLCVIVMDSLLCIGSRPALQRVLILVICAVELASYQTDAADDIVCGVDGDLLPAQLKGALQELVENLRSYRAFLPQSVLPAACAAAEDDAQDARAPSDGQPRRRFRRESLRPQRAIALGL